MSLAVIGLCALFFSSTLAEDNLIRFGPSYYRVVGDYSDPPAELDGGVGFFINYERRVSEKFGLDFGYQGAVFKLGLFGNEDVDMYALTVRANYYITRGEGPSFFVHPTIGLIDLDTREGSDSGFAWGAGVGTDVPLGKSKWVFSGSLNILTADILEM